jgi:O-antigen/teichoic acid export membrane protein
MSSAGEVGTRRAFADVGVQLGGRVLNLIPGVVVTLLLARSLGDAGFGRWSTLLAVVQIASYVGDFGLEQVAVRHAASKPEEEADWIAALLTFRLALTVPVMVATVIVQLLIASSAEMAAAGLILTVTLLAGAVNILRVTFQLRVRNWLTVLTTTVNSLVWAAGVVIIAAHDGGLVAFSLAFLGAAVVSVALTAVLALRIVPVRLRGATRHWRELLRVGVPVGIAGMLMTVYLRLDQVLLFLIAGAKESGLYAAAYRILDQAQYIPNAAMITFLPIIASAWPADAARVRRLSTGIAEGMALISLPALGFSIVAAEPTMRLLFGPAFVEAAPALPILMAAFVCVAFSTLFGYLVVIVELQRKLIVYAGISLVVNIALNAVLIPLFGFVGAAVATLVTELVMMVLTGRAVIADIELHPSAGRFARTALAATGMSLAVAGARAAGVGIGGLAAVAVVSYPALVLLLRAFSVAEARELLAARRAGG